MQLPVLIDQPGVYEMSNDDYHADPCVEPSLSASTAFTLISRSPRHAWLQHPRLNPKFEPEEKATFDLGELAHTLLLRDERAIHVIDAADFKTKDAREQRDQARKDGKIPVLKAKLDEVKAMVAAARAQCAAHEEAPWLFTAGQPEQTLIWPEKVVDAVVWCRVRLDWLPQLDSFPQHIFPDYKTTGSVALPDEWGRRTLFDLGNDVRAAFYLRGIRAVLKLDRPQYRFVVQETEPPYALSVMALLPHALEVADAKVEYAIRLWAWCRAKNYWPGYYRQTAYLDSPPWHEQQWLHRKSTAAQWASLPDDLKTLLLDWQAP